MGRGAVSHLMAVPDSQVAPEGAGPSLAGPSLAGPSLAGPGRLLLPRHRDRWTYMASPTVLHCIRGKIVPRLAKAWHTPGQGGNGMSYGTGAGYVTGLTQWGYVAVPHNIAVDAFGKSRASAPLSTYLDRHVGATASGQPVVYHCDAWQRPESIGHLTHWTQDHDGRLAFLVQVRGIIAPSGLLDMQVRLATEPLIKHIRRMMDRSDPASKRETLTALLNLPLEHAPPDLKGLAEEAQGKVQKKAATRRRR